MYCMKCGKELDDNASFCSRCGNKMQTKEKTEKKTEKKKKSRVVLITGVVALAVLILAGAGYFWQQKNKTSQKTIVPEKKEEMLFPMFDEETGLWGYVDIDENVVIPYEYAEVNYFGANRLAVVEDEENGLEGVIDKEGNEIVPCKYNYITAFSKDGYAVAKTDDYTAVIDSTGEEVLLSTDAEIHECYMGGYQNDLLRIYWYDEEEEECTYAYMNLEGEVVLEKECTSAGDFDEKGRAWVYEGEYYGYMNLKGEMIIECEYAMLGLIEDEYVLGLTKDNTEIVKLDLDGNIIESKTAEDYEGDSISWLFGRFVQVRKNGEEQYYTYEGEQLTDDSTLETEELYYNFAQYGKTYLAITEQTENGPRTLVKNDEGATVADNIPERFDGYGMEGVLFAKLYENCGSREIKDYFDVMEVETYYTDDEDDEGERQVISLKYYDEKGRLLFEPREYEPEDYEEY